MLDVEGYYEILELEPGASLEEICQGYQDLAIVWHPDRFSSHPRLREKAQEKFQQINEAHEQLRNHLLYAPPPHSARAQSLSRYCSYPTRVYRSQPQASAHSASYYQSSPKREVCAWLD